jgi:hypothetical protein
MDLPRFATADQRKQHTQRLRDELLRLWDGSNGDLMDRYLSDYDARAEPRPEMSLPWSATDHVLPPADSTIVRFTPPRGAQMNWSDSGETVSLSANGQVWQFAAAAAPILDLLARQRVCSIADICSATPDLSRDTVRAFLGEILLDGLVVVAS